METNWIKKKKIFSKRFYSLVALFLLILIPILTITLWINWAISAPATSGKAKVFVIQENESTVSIANRLKEEGLIRDSLVFRIYTRINCKGIDLANPESLLKKYATSDCLSGNIQAGSFKLSPTMTLATLSVTLTKGRLDSWTKIIEGLRDEEIAAILAKNYNIKAEDFLKEAKEGYMFPDTYLFSLNSTAKDLATKMRENFDTKFSPDLQSKVKAQGLTVQEGVILASIVQREAGKSSDAPTIASIFLNRLNSGMPLGSDATVQFALGYDQTTKTWWKKDLTDQDLTIDSPYNTRIVTGLPPGPICNPGLAALKAVAEPAVTDYYYFLHDKDGNLHPAKTLQEHNANKIRYLQ